MRLRRTHRVAPGFNLTPLMDILFIVLIFLVLTTTFKEATTFQVQLPTTRASETEPREIPGLIAIVVAADGEIALGRDPVTMPQLEERLAAIETPESITVRLRADAAVDHGVVVQVMDAVRRSGISQLSIETQNVPLRDR